MLFSQSLLAEPGLVDCIDPDYCNGIETYRPAFIFGAGPEGIVQARESIYQNRNLISAVLENELNTDNEDGLAAQYILPIANKDFPITDPIRLDEGEAPVQVPGLGFVLNPESFDPNNPDSSNATVSQITFTENDGLAGVNLSNFQLTDLTVDFSAFAAGAQNPKALVCSHIGVDINTSFAIEMKHGNETSVIAIEDLTLEVDSTQSSRVCFNIGIDLGNFQVTSINRLSNDPILTRAQIDEALNRDNLSLEIPSTSPLSKLEGDALRSMIASYTAPVFASPQIGSQIETPLLDSIQAIIPTQINSYLQALFENQTSGSIALPALNLPNFLVGGTISNNLEGANNLMNRNKKCKHVYRRLNNIIYWTRRAHDFADAAIAQDIEDIVSRVKNYNKCRNYKDINNKLTELSSLAQDITPNLSEAQELIMHQLPSLVDGNLSVEVFIPELCFGNVNPALAQGSSLNECESFYTMMDLSFINNFLKTQRDKGNICHSLKDGKCGIRVFNDKKDEQGQISEYDTPDFGCEDIQSVKLNTMPDGSLRATVKIKNCESRGKGMVVTNVGDFSNTDFEIVFDAKLKTDCPNEQKACFDLEFNEQLLDYTGRLETHWLEGTIKDVIVESLNELEDNFENTLNELPLNNMLQGLDVEKFFGSPIAGSPGFFGICLEMNQESETNVRYCDLAKLRLPSNHPALSQCPSD